MGTQQRDGRCRVTRDILRPVCEVILVAMTLCAVPAFAQGIITTVAGNGRYGYSGDGVPATQASMRLGGYTGGVAVDADGNLYIADTGNNRIRMVDRAGRISTVAGSGPGGYSGDGGLAKSAALSSPAGLAVDRSSNIYIVDSGNQRIRRVSPDGIITTVAGNGSVGYAGDGGPAVQASLRLNQYTGNCAVDAEGNLYIPDTENDVVRKVGSDGIITTVAHAFWPYSVAVDSAGNIYIGGEDEVVVRVDVAGRSVTIAGGGPFTASLPDTIPALEAWLAIPAGVAVDNMGNLYIADSHVQRVRKVTPDGTMTTVAGSGEVLPDIYDEAVAGGFSGDGGPATQARLNFPWGLAADGAGNVYVADSLNNRIRKVTASITDTWTPANADLNDGNITALAVDPTDSGTLYAGTGSHGVFKSTNEGGNWAPTGLGNVQVNVLVMDPSHPATLYAGTYDKGLLKSVDGGASWSTAGPDIQVVSSLAVDPHDSNSLLLAGYNRVDWSTTLVFRSTDAGRSWTHIYSARWVFSVATAPVDLNILYVLRSSGDPQDDRSQPYLLKSTDGGNTWAVHNPPDIGIYQLVVDPTEPSRLFAYGGRSFRSTDGGETWAPHTLRIDSIVADPLNSATLYSIASGDVYRSTDHGGSWSLTEGLTDAVQALAVSGSNPPALFAGTQTQGVYKTSAMLTLDRTEYCLGTTWTASIVNAAPDAATRLVGVSDGVQWAWPDWGTTGSDGKYSTAGTFAAGSEGNHQLYVEIGGIRSNTVSFSVSGCKPPAYQPRLEVAPPPGPNGFCLGASWGLSVANAMAETEIRLVGITDGVPWEWPGWGRTGSDGGFSMGGTFADGSQGKHILYVDIGGIKSNVVPLSVSDCAGPAYQPHLLIEPSPAPDGFCPAGVSWILKLTGAPPNAAVRLVGDSAGVPPGFKLPEGSQTDSKGNFSASGPVTLPAGKYNLAVEVGIFRSNTVPVEIFPDCE